MKLENYILPHVLKLEAYSSARSEMNAKKGIFLDANENPYGTLNRYPDPLQSKLKKGLAKWKSVELNQIFIGNGSDEIIDLIIRMGCQPGKDKIALFTPTYGMYEVSAVFNNVEVVSFKLDDEFQLKKESISEILGDRSIKLVIFCSPNNPTGNNLDRTFIENLVAQFQGLVLIDEAYIDFSSEASWVDSINKWDNLIVSQTFSKAFGLAAARIGVAYSNSKLISILNKVKPPYNISLLNQNAALKALKKRRKIEMQVKVICLERERLLNELKLLPCILKVYPSDANFVLAKVNDANQLYYSLLKSKVIVRNRTKIIENCLRITLGTPKENKLLINELSKIK